MGTVMSDLKSAGGPKMSAPQVASGASVSGMKPQTTKAPLVPGERKSTPLSTSGGDGGMPPNEFSGK